MHVFPEQFFDQIYRMRYNCDHHKTKMLEELKLNIPPDPISMDNLFKSPITDLIDNFIVRAVNDLK